jgi:hypothetical protein
MFETFQWKVLSLTMECTGISPAGKRKKSFTFELAKT